MKKHTQNKEDSGLPQPDNDNDKAQSSGHVNGAAAPPWSKLGLDPETLAKAESADKAENNGVARLKLAYELGRKVGHLEGTKAQADHDFLVLRKYAKRLRRVKHALHAVTTEALND